MHITLQSDAIRVHANSTLSNDTTAQAYLSQAVFNMQFDTNFVRIQPTPALHKSKLQFLQHLSKKTTKSHKSNAHFFFKSIKRMQHYPIEVHVATQAKTIDVTVKALSTQRVELVLSKPCVWYALFMHSMLGDIVLHTSPSALVLSVTTLYDKQAFEKSLTFTHLFGAKIAYHFDNNVLSTLFVPYAPYYHLLQCDTNASPLQLKQNYKRLAKRYHPDTVAHQNDPQKLAHYTQTFQALHEAYTKTVGVS